jgi:hypothetical protein
LRGSSGAGASFAFVAGLIFSITPIACSLWRLLSCDESARPLGQVH